MTSLSQQMDLNHVSQQADFAQSIMSSICGEHHLDTLCRNTLDFHYDGIRLPKKSMTMGLIRYGAPVSINISQLRAYSISLPIYGQQSLEMSGVRYASDANCGLIVSNNALQNLQIDQDCEKLQVVIPEQSLALVLSDLLQQPLLQPIVFEPQMNIQQSKALALWWKNVENFVAMKNLYAGFQGLELFAHDYENFMIKTLLLAQENNYSQALAALNGSEIPAHVMKVKQYLVEHADQAICADDLQRIAGVSKSKLYQEFQHHYASSPMQYLRQYRLQQVFQALNAFELQHMSISKLALDWGFNHLSRFSQEYRDCFGESPSETRAKMLCRYKNTA